MVYEYRQVSSGYNFRAVWLKIIFEALDKKYSAINIAYLC